MVFAGPADVVDDLVVTVFVERFGDPAADVLERFFPGDRLELTGPARAAALERREDALVVLDLVDRRGPLGTRPSTTAWMDRVAFELLDLAGRLVDEREQTAS